MPTAPTITVAHLITVMRLRTITSPFTTDGPTTLGLHPLITAGATTTIPGTAITTITISRIPPILLRPPGSPTTSSLRTSELPMKRAWPERLARFERLLISLTDLTASLWSSDSLIAGNLSADYGAALYMSA